MGKKNKLYKEDEIDLLELIQAILNEKRTVLKSVIVFGLIGLFIAVFSAKEYTASTTLVPQTASGNVGSNLGGLAAMAGININSGGVEGIPPSLYPKIINSVPFRLEMLKTNISLKEIKQDVTYSDYLDNYQKFNLLSTIKRYTIGLPGVIIGSLKGKKDDDTLDDALKTNASSLIRVSAKDYNKMKSLSSIISIYINDKEGFVELSVSMPEPLSAAQMTAKAQKLLQEAIIEFKVNKVQEELNFIESRCKEAKKKFLDKQNALAYFKDKNKGIITALYATRLERLQADYNLAYNLYSELAKKLETQKIQVKENTPVFTIIEPVSVPIKRSKPNRIMILVNWLFLGVVLGLVLVLARIFLKKMKTR